MSKQVKRWLFIATVLIVIGALIFCGAMTSIGWDFSRFSTYEIETSEYNIEEQFSSLKIDTDTSDIEVLPSTDGRTLVVCREYENESHSVDVKDGVLTVELVDSRKWYEYIGIGSIDPKVTIYLPEGEYSTLSISASTSDILVREGFSFESVTLELSTGDIEFSADARGALSISTSTGDVDVRGGYVGSLDISTTTGDIEMSSVVCDGKATVEITSGDVALEEFICTSIYINGSTSDIHLDDVVALEKMEIETSTGDVELERCDAEEIRIETTTGDVIGTLLTPKVFSARSSTGDVEVPKSKVGGVCEITCSTGSIYIEVLEN